MLRMTNVPAGQRQPISPQAYLRGARRVRTARRVACDIEALDNQVPARLQTEMLLTLNKVPGRCGSVVPRDGAAGIETWSNDRNL